LTSAGRGTPQAQNGRPHADTAGPIASVKFACHGANQLSSQSSRKVRFDLPGGGPIKAGWGGMGQFHVTVYVTNPRSAHIATEAMLDRTLIAMSSDIDETVTGFVQSIEEDAEAVPRRWRITILEADSRHSALVVSFLRFSASG
jgi:hypothetical protein